MPFLPHSIAYKIMAVGGVSLFICSMAIIGLGTSVRSWPSVTGQVVSAATETIRSPNGHDEYNPVVQYKYNVGERLFYSSRLIFGGASSTNERWSESKLEVYRHSKTIPVKYFPLFPSLSAVEPGFSSSLWVLSLVGLFVYCLSFIASCIHKNTHSVNKKRAV
jgi:Protein of unknown function (DUF3592)